MFRYEPRRLLGRHVVEQSVGRVANVIVVVAGEGKSVTVSGGDAG